MRCNSYDQLECRASGESGCGTGERDHEGLSPKYPGGRENPGPVTPAGESGCAILPWRDQLRNRLRQSFPTLFESCIETPQEAIFLLYLLAVAPEKGVSQQKMSKFFLH